MTTQKQRLANKRNAQQSTGPKTDEGKQRSSQNALKHGTYALESVIPGEDPADFDHLCTEFGERYLPDGPYERSLVRQMADAEWRMRRIMRLEADFLKAADDDVRQHHNRCHPGEPEPDDCLLRRRALQTRTLELQRFGRYEADLSRRQRQAHKALMDCRKQENQEVAAIDSGVPSHGGPREPFYHPAGDPTVQYNELPERTRICPTPKKPTTSGPPGSNLSDESAV
jgi:hypothetical protein